MKTIALVGDRSATVRAHTRIPRVLDAVRETEQLDLDVYWVPTEAAAEPGALTGFSGIWLTPGSPYRSEAGGIAAARTARTAGIPFLATCAGFQHAMLEFARDVCGLENARHAERGETDGEDLIVALSCSLAGHEAAVTFAPGSLAERLTGTSRSVERYHCAYGLAAGRLDLLSAHGMLFTGHDQEHGVRVAELPTHPFYLTTLFQPELAAGGPHPLIRGFARAAAARGEVS
jgi:CTP synthase (UTP-ammonia lyase)